MALASGRTLAIPLLTSTLTTILAFAPIPLAIGGTGEYTKSLGLVLIIKVINNVLHFTLDLILEPMEDVLVLERRWNISLTTVDQEIFNEMLRMLKLEVVDYSNRKLKKQFNADLMSL